MFTRPYSPMLTVTCMIAMLQQWTGINGAGGTGPCAGAAPGGVLRRLQAPA